MKIGVFGGSFNPPHKMHLNIGLELVNKQYVDKVIYVPTGSKYKYKNNLLPDKNRLEMLEILTKTQEYLDVNDYELKDEVVYTCETLAYFKELYPNDEIYFICGADNLSYIDKWKNGEKILNNYKIIAMKRKGEDIEELLKKFVDYQNNIIVADVEQQDISSTDIIEKLKNNENVLDVLDKDVYEYIRKNKLLDISEALKEFIKDNKYIRIIFNDYHIIFNSNEEKIIINFSNDENIYIETNMFKLNIKIEAIDDYKIYNKKNKFNKIELNMTDGATIILISD